MKGYSKQSLLLGGCLLSFMPLLGQAQAFPSSSVNPSSSVAPNKVLPSDNQVAPALSKAPSTTDRISAILDFWFGSLSGPDFFPKNKMPIWFSSTPEIDRQIRDYFFRDMLNAQQGKYNQWRETPRGRLALILLLDQFPRHIYRGNPQAFRLDQMARALVLEGMQKGEDKCLYFIERAFFYLPLEHAENLEMQNRAVDAYRQLFAESPESIRPQMQDFLQSAIAHQQQIIRFGRFPYRNAILGRTSTPEETVFLMQSGKGVSGK